MRKLTWLPVAVGTATAAAAASGDLSGEAIRPLVTGATVEIDTPLGKRIPVRYHADGRLSGEAGELAPYLGSASDKGRWWVQADELCLKWLKWLNGEPQCLRLRTEGGKIRWQDQAGNSGTAIIAAREAVAVPQQPVIAKAEPKTSSAPRPQVAAAPAQPKPQPQAQPQPKAQPQPQQDLAGPLHRVRNVESGDVLNVRNGPSAEDTIVGALQPDEKGVRLAGGCQSQWCPISHRGVAGWVNAAYLAREDGGADRMAGAEMPRRDTPGAPRSCLTAPARQLLEEIEAKFGAVRVVSTCRPGAMIAGTNHPSRHASGNAVDFDAGPRKQQIIDWLVANHKAGGTMTYADMDHIHVDIGRHFVSLADQRTRMSRSNSEPRDWSGQRMGLTGRSR
jgi:hypothetical protein